MKSFKEYLIESKQTYEFKIKLAGDYEDCTKKVGPFEPTFREIMIVVFC
jgi:hypothetical protein